MRVLPRKEGQISRNRFVRLVSSRDLRPLRFLEDEHDDKDDNRLMRRQKTEPARVEVLVS